MDLFEKVKENMESREDFYNRTYWNYIKEIVLIWSTSSQNGVYKIWDVDEATRYLKRLPNKATKVSVNHSQVRAKPASNEIIAIIEEKINSNEIVEVELMESRTGKILRR